MTGCEINRHILDGFSSRLWYEQREYVGKEFVLADLEVHLVKVEKYQMDKEAADGTFALAACPWSKGGGRGGRGGGGQQQQQQQQQSRQHYGGWGASRVVSVAGNPGISYPSVVRYPLRLSAYLPPHQHRHRSTKQVIRPLCRRTTSPPEVLCMDHLLRYPKLRHSRCPCRQVPKDR